MIEVMRRLVLSTAAATLLSALSTPVAAQLYACRGYPSPGVIRDIKAHVETMRRVEREAADRLVGLDTRPYEWLLDQAQKAEAEIAVPVLLEAEQMLARCRNYIRPVRRGCAAAATALVRVVKVIIAGEASGGAKKTYAEVMPHCEQAVSLTPLDTALRHLE